MLPNPMRLAGSNQGMGSPGGRKIAAMTPRSHGKGPRDQRTGHLEGGNIRIETVVSNEVLEKILETLTQNYFPHYACTTWVSQVEVVRDERY